MVKKKVDPRVKGLIEYNARHGYRSMFVLVGDHGKDQVENLHKILSRTRVRARPSVLWCYKKELGFSTHRKKRMKEIKRNQARGLHDPDRDDPFDLFISSTTIRWTYYKETDKILGQTFGMCVLQDFEALTPNLLARTIETVEGGGIVVLLLKTVKSLKQLYTLSMDVHNRFRTEAHHEIVPRFNERFILSLSQCKSCLVLDDELNVLPVSSKMDHIPTSEGGMVGLSEGEADASGILVDPELEDLKHSLADTPNVGVLVNLSKTLDQANAVMSFLDAISEKTLRSTVALTASRGRGKSAAIGLCLAGAVSYGYSNIFVTAPSPENLKTVFEFIVSGLKALRYTEHMDYEILSEHAGDIGKVVVRINIFKDHRQTIQYIAPTDHARLAQAELVAIDEAAAIPLPTVRKLMGPYLVFMSSTINGYEGTGRSLSLKLIQQLRTQQGQAMVDAAKNAGQSVAGTKTKKGEKKVHEERWRVAAEAAAAVGSETSASRSVRSLTELTLDTPIRYAKGDAVEKWLNDLLCLDIVSNTTRMVSVMPAPKDCALYMVNRDALFSYHSMSETLLQRIWALYTAAHYKNTPNDLQMLSDAPAHRLFVLLGPQRGNSAQLPDVLCVVQVAFEGFISQKSVQSELAKGNKASGDLIPWTISQQFNDSEFASLSGARIVRIATHPDVQKMGYGSRAIDLLNEYFTGDLSAGAGPAPKVGSFGGEGGVDDEEDEVAMDDNDEDNEDENDGTLQHESVRPRKKLPPLLTALEDRPAERLHWLGVSFGLTSQLLNFWCRKGFKTCYLRQTTNELTGEHSSILLRELNSDDIVEGPQGGWLEGYVADYRRRMVSLMSYNFRSLDTVLAITLVDPDRKLTSSSGEGGDDAAAARAALIAAEKAAESVSKDDRSPMLPLNAKELLSTHLSHHDMKRLELYSRNMVDHHMIIDTLPTLSKLLFTGRMPGLRLSYLQVAILLGTGLQHRDVDSLASELEIPVSQVLAFFNKTVRKIVSYLRSMVEADVSKSLPSKGSIHAVRAKAGEMETLTTSLADEQTTNAADFSKQQKEKDDARSALLKKGKGASKHSLGGVRDEDLEAAAQLSAKKSKAPLTSISVAVPTPDKSNESGASTGKKAKKDKKRKQSEVGTDDSGEGNMIAEVSDVDGDDAVKASGKKDKSKKKKKLSIA